MRDSSTHSVFRRPVMSLALAAALLATNAGCKDEGADDGTAKDEGKGGQGATETNVAPAPCKSDGECPKGIECVFHDEDAELGFCDVNEMHVKDAGADAGGDVSSSAPAPCDDSDDCPPGIECKSFDEGGPGFCDVGEMSVTPSSAAPAPCDSQDDCPPGVECKSFDGAGGPGFCNVSEMIAP